MGCGASKPKDLSVPTSSVAMTATGGGSLVISAPASKRASNEAQNSSSSDGSMLPTKGGSYIIGRKEIGSWEPGSEIVRPNNTTETQTYWIPTLEGTVLRITFASVSKQGRSPKPPHKPNQDSFLHIDNLGNKKEVALFSVFDGHGPCGEDASNFSRINLPDCCVSQTKFEESPFDALVSSFEDLHRRFIGADTARSGVDTSVSGTTAVSIMFNGRNWLCANVGDSRAMIASRNAKGGLVAKAVSSDHKPQRPDEKERILSTNAKILSEEQIGIPGGDPEKLYVCRIHNGVIRYGVLFTRSIGDADAHRHLGLVAVPELKRGTIDASRDRFMVLASDGVWDFLGENNVARIVAQSTGMSLKSDFEGHAEADAQATERAQAAANALVLAAEAKWDADGGSRRDDITVTVLMFREFSAEEAARLQELEKNGGDDEVEVGEDEDDEDDEEEEEEEDDDDDEADEVADDAAAAESK